MSSYNESIDDFLEKKISETDTELYKLKRIQCELRRNQYLIKRQKKLIDHFSKCAINNNSSLISDYIQTRLNYDSNSLHISSLVDLYRDYTYWKKQVKHYPEDSNVTKEDFETHMNTVFMVNVYGRYDETYKGYCGVSIKYSFNIAGIDSPVCLDEVKDISLLGSFEDELDGTI